MTGALPLMLFYALIGWTWLVLIIWACWHLFWFLMSWREWMDYLRFRIFIRYGLMWNTGNNQ